MIIPYIKRERQQRLASVPVKISVLFLIFLLKPNEISTVKGKKPLLRTLIAVIIFKSTRLNLKLTLN